jgi:hypothetical protein
MVGCTATNIRPVQDLATVKEVCIQENPAVIVDDFVTVLRDGFQSTRDCDNRR